MKTIEFYLKENHLSTSEENLYKALVHKKKPVRQEELIEIMQGKNTTVTRQDMIVVMDLFRETVMEQILSGFPVYTDLFKADVSIRGGFTSGVDVFDEARHRVCVNMNGADKFKKDLVKNAQVEHVLSVPPTPVIRQVFDYQSGSYRTDFQAGSTINIRGAFFKDENRETEVYLYPDGSAEKIPVETVHQVMGRTILCELPEDLTPGVYRISVALLGEGNQISQSTFNKKLTIS